jgi:hypothetical protein
MTSSRPIGKLVLHRRSAGVAMATLDAFFLMRMFGDVSAEDIYATLTCHEHIIAEHPQGSVSIVAVDPTTSFPSDEMRRAAVEITKKTRPQTLGHVVIVLGGGFWASAFRGALTTMNSLNRSTYPKNVVRAEDEGVEWAIETLGESKARYRFALLAALVELKQGSVAAKPVTSLRP